MVLIPPPDTSGLPKAFHGATLKVERAENHIKELEGIIENIQVQEGEPLDITRDADGRYSLNISDLGEMGYQIPIVLGDAVHNLRAALDHVWTALDRAATGKPNSFANFPFDETRQNLVNRVDTSVVKCAFPKAGDLILDDIKTHCSEGGNHRLWSLTKLDNLDKHNMLIPTIELRKISKLFVRSGGAEMTFDDCEFGGELTLLDGPIAPEYYCRGKITINPVFPEGIAISGESVLKTLIYQSEATRNAINLFKENIP